MTPQTQQQRTTGIRPLRKRKRLWAAGAALFALGAIGGTQSAQDEVDAARALAAKPAPTVTATATATATVTAEPEPAPTVTKTKKVTTPGPTVTVTKTARAASGSGAGNSAGSGNSGTCSIVSNSGNCYRAGQYCRNSDHGATTTTAGGARITCRYSSNAWRWSSS
ncbi:hypothetical protein AB0M25_13945 [Streptomyces griseomycini]|uniref:hypothetical protein n=1 Tax=Streptomyces griseomycini TaxID=66895 RepID=UPI003427A1C9